MPLPNRERGATGCRRWPWTGRRGTEDASDRLRRRSDVKLGHVKAWSAISTAKNFPARHLLKKRKTPSVSISISLSVSLDRHTIAFIIRGFVQVDFYTRHLCTNWVLRGPPDQPTAAGTGYLRSGLEERTQQNFFFVSFERERERSYNPCTLFSTCYRE